MKFNLFVGAITKLLFSQLMLGEIFGYGEIFGALFLKKSALFGQYRMLPKFSGLGSGKHSVLAYMNFLFTDLKKISKKTKKKTETRLVIKENTARVVAPCQKTFYCCGVQFKIACCNIMACD